MRRQYNGSGGRFERVGYPTLSPVFNPKDWICGRLLGSRQHKISAPRRELTRNRDTFDSQGGGVLVRDTLTNLARGTRMRIPRWLACRPGIHKPG